ncbi:MAG: hypothetical protein QNK11_08700 [Legionella sp.]|nr:hypothetical protein [Legionella sp.]
MPGLIYLPISNTTHAKDIVKKFEALKKKHPSCVFVYPDYLSEHPVAHPLVQAANTLTNSRFKLKLPMKANDGKKILENKAKNAILVIPVIIGPRYHHYEADKAHKQLPHITIGEAVHTPYLFHTTNASIEMKFTHMSAYVHKFEQIKATYPNITAGTEKTKLNRKRKKSKRNVDAANSSTVPVPTETTAETETPPDLPKNSQCFFKKAPSAKQCISSLLCLAGIAILIATLAHLLPMLPGLVVATGLIALGAGLAVSPESQNKETPKL